MTTHRDQVFRSALELDSDDRTQLVALLVDSLDAASEPDVEEAWMQEIDRRIDQLDTSVTATLRAVPWDATGGRVKRAG